VVAEAYPIVCKSPRASASYSVNGVVPAKTYTRYLFQRTMVPLAISAWWIIILTSKMF
jgi:hypothetical protein